MGRQVPFRELTCEKPCVNETGNELVVAARCGHIIDHAVDQLDPPLVRDLIIVGQGDTHP